MSTTETEPECRRRAEDTLEYKVSRAAKFIGGLIVIGSVITWAGSTIFATKTEVKEMFDGMDRSYDLTVERTTTNEKDILVIKTKLENIEKSQELQLNTSREILRAVSK